MNRPACGSGKNRHLDDSFLHSDEESCCDNRCFGLISSSIPLYLILAIAGIRLIRVLLSVSLVWRFIDHRHLIDFGFSINIILI